MGEPRSENEQKKLFLQICKAINVFHSNKIAHMDIKPENILLDRDGNIKLADFGSCVHFDDTISESALTTILYSAPEARKYVSFDKAAADIWSLGVVFYVLVAGAYPFVGETETQIVQSIKRGQLDLTELESGNFSLSLKSLIKQMLQFDPTMRPSICQVLYHLSLS